MKTYLSVWGYYLSSQKESKGDDGGHLRISKEG